MRKSRYSDERRHFFIAEKALPLVNGCRHLYRRESAAYNEAVVTNEGSAITVHQPGGALSYESGGVIFFQKRGILPMNYNFSLAKEVLSLAREYCGLSRIRACHH